MEISIVVLCAMIWLGTATGFVFADDSTCQTNGKPDAAKDGKVCGQKNVTGGMVNLVCNAGKCIEAKTASNTDGKQSGLTDPSDVQKAAEQEAFGDTSATMQGGSNVSPESGIADTPDSGTQYHFTQDGQSTLQGSGGTRPNDPSTWYQNKPVDVVNTKVDNSPSPGTAAYNTRQAALQEMSSEPPSPYLPKYGNYEVVPVKWDSFENSPLAQAVFSSPLFSSPPSVGESYGFSSYSGGNSGYSGAFGGSYSAQTTGWGSLSPSGAYISQTGFSPSSCSGGLCLATGQAGSGVVQPVNVASSRPALLDAAEAQLQAQETAKNAGTIANYLGNDVWNTKSFGEWVSEGVQNAGEQIQNAWDGAVAGVQDAFAPSVVDTSSVNGISDAAGVSGSSDGSSVGNSSNDTLQGADGYQLPEVVVDTSAKPADWAGEQGRDSIGHDITDDLSSPDDVAPAKDGFSFDQAAIDRGKSYYTTDADLTNPKNLASPFIGMKSPVDFEIRPGDASPLPPEVSQMHETAFQGFEQTYTGTAFPNPSTGQNSIMNRVNPDAGTTGGTVPPPVNTTGVGRESVSTGRTSVDRPAPSPAPSGGSGGGFGDIGQMLSSLMGMLKGGGGGGSGGGNSQPQLPPVTAASNSVLQTPVPSTQFTPAPPLTAAPTVSVVANPDDIASGAQSVIAWSAVWADAQATSTTRECAVIDATGKTLVQSASTTSSYETGTLARSAYYVVGCKQSGGKLGSGVVLVKVKGDTQGPIPLPANLGTYQSVTGSSNPAAELSNAIRPAGAAQQPQQVVEVACDPNSQNYIDCLTGKMQFVDKLYE